MEHPLDLRQPMPTTISSLEPLTADDDGSLAGPGRRQYSYWAECECPDDCLRDHENE